MGQQPAWKILDQAEAGATGNTLGSLWTLIKWVFAALAIGWILNMGNWITG